MQSCFSCHWPAGTSSFERKFRTGLCAQLSFQCQHKNVEYVGSAWALSFIWRAPQAQHSQEIPLESDSNLTFKLKLSQDIVSFRLNSSLTIHTCFRYRSFWDTIQFQVDTNYHFLLYKTHQPIKRRRHMSNVGISN